QAVDQDKEEDRQQQRHVFLVVVPQVGLADVVPDKSDHRLYGILETRRSRFYTLPLGIFAGDTAHDPNQQQHRDQHLDRISGQRQIVYLLDGVRLRLPVGIHGIDLPGLENLRIELILRDIAFFEQPVALIGLLAVFKTGRHEYRPARVLRIKDHRQRYGNRLLIEREKMKFVGVTDVLQNLAGRVPIPGIRHIRKKYTK